MKITKENAMAHVVFDNDGTMVDGEENFFTSMVKILPKYLNREVTYQEMVERNIPDWVQLLKNFGIENPSIELIQNMIDDLRDMNIGYVPVMFPEIKNIISKLHSLKIATYVWTGRDKESAIKLFDAHNITSLFHDMRFKDCALPKPHPSGLEEMLGDVEKSKIVLIGDSIVDINGAKAFNIPCLVVDWKKQANHNDLMNQGAAKVVQTKDELLTWVTENLL
jgi:phosphoglycolate phosphatase